MAYVTIPKDLTKVKSKLLFGLTKRQLFCFGGGALIGVPLFFLLRQPLGTSVAAMVMMLAMLPAFLLALYEKNGQPLERVLRNILRVCFLRPKQRPYKTNNLYAALQKQIELEAAIRKIEEKYESRNGGEDHAGGTEKKPGGEKGNRRPAAQG